MTGTLDVPLVSMIATGLLAMASQRALAQKAPPPRQELAAVGTSGNSSSIFSAGAGRVVRAEGWLVRNRVLAVRGASEGDVTAESLLDALRTEHTANSTASRVDAGAGYLNERRLGRQTRIEAGEAPQAPRECRQVPSFSQTW